MAKLVALAGFEEEFEILRAKSENLQIDIDNAKAEANAKIDLEFAKKAEKINNLLTEVSTVEEEIIENEEEIIAEVAEQEKNEVNAEEV